MPRISRCALATAVFAVLLAACGGASDSEIFALYRNSVTSENMRLHIATFDSRDGEAYNRENCEQAKLLFQAQPGVKTRFWCEKGRFKN